MRYHAARCHEGRDSQSSSNVLGGFERDFSYQLCNPPKVERHVSLRQNHWLASEFQEMFIFYLEPPKANQFGNGWKWLNNYFSIVKVWESSSNWKILSINGWPSISRYISPSWTTLTGSRVTWRLKCHHPYQRIPVYLWTRQKVKVRGSMVILHWMIQL